MVYFGYQAADERENKRVERQRENESRAETIYMRLRYIENDHIVFDPLTKKKYLLHPIKFVN